MKLLSTLISAVVTTASIGVAGAAETDCVKLSVSVRHAIEAQKTTVLEVVEEKVSANPDCACEIVKAAIIASEADAKLVAAIVEVAATSAPEHMRLISQCALAAAPDALPDIMAVINRLNPASGESAPVDTSKNPKEPIEVKPAWNPLDFPGEGVGPNPGGPGGFPLIPEPPPGPHIDGKIPPQLPNPGTNANFGDNTDLRDPR